MKIKGDYLREYDVLHMYWLETKLIGNTITMDKTAAINRGDYQETWWAMEPCGKCAKSIYVGSKFCENCGVGIEWKGSK